MRSFHKRKQKPDIKSTCRIQINGDYCDVTLVSSDKATFQVCLLYCFALSRAVTTGYAEVCGAYRPPLP